MKNLNIFIPALKVAVFENNGDLMDVVEDLNYHGYRKAVGIIERFLPDIQNYKHFPKEHWKKIRTTNLMERVNKEEKRRSRVIGAFPSDESLIRLIGSIMMDINEEWVTGKRYLTIDSCLTEYCPGENPEISPQGIAIQEHA